MAHLAVQTLQFFLVARVALGLVADGNPLEVKLPDQLLQLFVLIALCAHGAHVQITLVLL